MSYGEMDIAQSSCMREWLDKYEISIDRRSILRRIPRFARMNLNWKGILVYENECEITSAEIGFSGDVN
jgi:hypothetical protein